MLNEAGHSEKIVADAMTRYLLGDRNSALSVLDKMKNADFGTFIESDTAEYNKQYDRIFQQLTKIIKRG